MLLGAAHEIGLPVEAVNSAADYFIRRIAGWRDHIEIFRSGSRARLFRPSATLFLLLKVDRLSERDFEDCLTMLSRSEREGIPLERERVLAVLDGLGTSGDPDLEARRERLRAILAETTGARSRP